jgi:methyl-accepting chemotaxis protein
MAMPKRDERGLVGVVLTIVIVWALIAVVMLTRTLVAAQQIQSTVVGIKGSVNGANSHLNTGCNPGQANNTCSSTALPVLTQTEALASQINDAAKPLTGQLGQVVTAANSINGTVSQILANATSINGTVHTINASATSIGGSVNQIGASLSGVNSDVINIQQGIVAINAKADTIIAVVQGIKGDTATINGQAGAILVQAQNICGDKLEPLGLGIPGLGLLPLGRIC